MHSFIMVMVGISGLLLVIGLLSQLIKQTPLVSEPLVALVAGILFGPKVLNLIDPFAWPDHEHMLELITLVTLAIGLRGVALRIPFQTLRESRGSIVVLLLVVMPLMWFASTALVALILRLPLSTALLIGAIITPTDPIVATSIVTGDVATSNLPERLRHLISAESGLNDGLAFPLVFLAIYLISTASGTALIDWLTQVVLWQTLAGGALGAAVGWVGVQLLRYAEQRQSIEHPSFLTYTVMLSLFVLGVVELAGANGVFAVFIAGVVFSYFIDASQRVEEAGIQESISLLFTLPVFVFVGLTIPWAAWLDLGWPALGVVVAVLLLRRLPFLLALRPRMGVLERGHDALFVGWFGPIGVAALFYALVAGQHVERDAIWHVTSLMIVASIMAHGASATTFTRLYARRANDSGQVPVDGVE